MNLGQLSKMIVMLINDFDAKFKFFFRETNKK